MLEKSFGTVNLTSGQTDSVVTAVPPGFRLAGIITPAAVTGATLSLKGAVDPTSGTVFPIYNGSALYSVSLGASRFIVFDPDLTKGLNQFSLVSASAEGANRVFTAVYVRE